MDWQAGDNLIALFWRAVIYWIFHLQRKIGPLSSGESPVKKNSLKRAEKRYSDEYRTNIFFSLFNLELLPIELAMPRTLHIPYDLLYLHTQHTLVVIVTHKTFAYCSVHNFIVSHVLYDKWNC